MFRDREKALQALQEQLLEEDEESLEADDLPEEVYADYAADVRAYNSDTTDTDLDDYSQQVYEAPRKRTGCVLWIMLLTAGFLLLLSWILYGRIL